MNLETTAPHSGTGGRACFAGAPASAWNGFSGLPLLRQASSVVPTLSVFAESTGDARRRAKLRGHRKPLPR